MPKNCLETLSNRVYYKTDVKGIEENDVAISGTGLTTIPEKRWEQLDEFKAKQPAPAELESNTFDEAMEKMFVHRRSPLHLIGGVMFRRDYVGDTRFNTDVYIGEDFLFIYENLIKGSGAAFLKQNWYYCRHHKNNSSWDFGFEGFYTRYLRRQLVWESEEKLGRKKYANLQKRNLIFIFSNCQQKSGLKSEDTKKMRRLMKKQRCVFKKLSLKDKLHYFAVVYLPRLYYLVLKKYKKNSSAMRG